MVTAGMTAADDAFIVVDTDTGAVFSVDLDSGRGQHPDSSIEQ